MTSRSADEWANLAPATRLPRSGTKPATLFACVNRYPSNYRDLWLRAGFESDPFLRTALRQWAKAGWICRTIDGSGNELWFRNASGSENHRSEAVASVALELNGTTVLRTNCSPVSPEPLQNAASTESSVGSEQASARFVAPESSPEPSDYPSSGPRLDVEEQLGFLQPFALERGLLYQCRSPSIGVSDCYIFSHDMQYRYAFARQWATHGPLVLWIGVNPAKGDTEERRRPTLDRCIDWSKSWGAAGLVFANLFAARHNKPSELRGMADPIGEYNDDALIAISAIAWRTVAAWGNDGQLLNRPKAVADLLNNPVCLGFTSSGQPRHPLYVKGGTSLVAWTIASH